MHEKLFAALISDDKTRSAVSVPFFQRAIESCTHWISSRIAWHVVPVVFFLTARFPNVAKDGGGPHNPSKSTSSAIAVINHFNRHILHAGAAGSLADRGL